MADSETKYVTSNNTVLILVFCLLGLIVLLIFLYKKLNREANGEYTIRRMVYKEGGIRDRVRGAAVAVGTRLGVQLWPQRDAVEEEDEMQEVQDEEGLLEEGGSQGSDSEGDEEEEEEEDNDAEQCGKAKGEGDDASADESEVEGSEAGEQTRLTEESEAKEETEGKREEKVGERESKGEASGGAGLLIDLKQFSGSAIWSGEEGGEGKDRDVTAL